MSKCTKCAAPLQGAKFCKKCGNQAPAGAAGLGAPVAEVERLLASQKAERDARRTLRQQAVASRDSGRPAVPVKPSVEPAALQAEAAAQAARIVELEHTVEAQDESIEKLEEALAQKAQRIVDLEAALELHKAGAGGAPKASAPLPVVAAAALRCSVCSADKGADAYTSSQRKKKGKRVCQPCVLAKSKPVAAK